MSYSNILMKGLEEAFPLLEVRLQTNDEGTILRIEFRKEHIGLVNRFQIHNVQNKTETQILLEIKEKMER